MTGDVETFQAFMTVHDFTPSEVGVCEGGSMGTNSVHGEGFLNFLRKNRAA